MKPRGLLPRVALGLAALLVAVSALKVVTKQGYTDFEVYFEASRRLISGATESVYQRTDGETPMRYFPSTLILLYPLSLLPFEVSRALWFALQAAGFGLGYLFLHRALRCLRVPRPKADRALAWVFLLTARFIYDAFTIGQISGFMFAALGLATWGYALKLSSDRGARRLSFGLCVPSLLKLGPGLLALPSLRVLWKSRKTLTESLLVAAGVTLVPLGVLALLGHSPTALLQGYFSVSRVAFEPGSPLYEANRHYGSQSLHSALLRLSDYWPWLSAHVRSVWFAALAISLLAYAAIVMRLRPSLTQWALGLQLYLLLMPFQFKYSFPFLAISLLPLVLEESEAPHARLLRQALLGVTALGLSLAGLDLYGEALFFGLQKASVPTVIVTLLTLDLFARARKPYI